MKEKRNHGYANISMVFEYMFTTQLSYNGNVTTYLLLSTIEPAHCVFLYKILLKSTSSIAGVTVAFWVRAS